MSIEVQLHNRVLRVKLNRPEKRNALNLATCRALNQAILDANRNPAVGAVLITGAGPAFCSGMDLREAEHAGHTALADAHDRLFTIREWAEKPVIQAVHGPAIAGGTGLAANAHVLFAAEDASFGLTEIRLGLWPVLIFPAMIAAVGERRAVELALSGRIFSAEDAHEYGLVSEIVPQDELQSRALAFAEMVAGSSAMALRSGLDYVRRIRGKPLGEALEIGRTMRDELMRHGDFAEGVRAWKEKTKPDWPSLREV
ncbi:enoyl-CoA hydratase/isomerase family protein [Nevskia soli]|jgi:enoyl-CoA hydratase/carnithine racemase|uniref:enoyl-CoA hydratase/isomerase family protein n=1 Tax=Nevskia soli TaxID=418856 RepID=UPI0015D784CF|nr:enoyl-CoA hydratase/isomerase family protein [Nevskia soli]